MKYLHIKAPFIVLVMVIFLIIFSACEKNENTRPHSLPEFPPGKIYHGNLVNPTAEELQAFFDDGYNVIDGFVALWKVEDLNSLKGLSNITFVKGDIYIENGSEIKSLEGLNNLDSIGKSLSILMMKNLVDINDLSNLKSIGGRLNIFNNISLLSLDGIENIEIVECLIKITGNDSLVDFCAIKDLLSEDGAGGEVWIYENAFNPTVEDIINGDCSL
jgi:hypothetical protein